MKSYIRRLLTQCVKVPPTSHGSALRRRSRARLGLNFLLEDRVTPTTYTVNDIGDAGNGSGNSGDLRYCITQANSNGGPDTINFSLGSGTQTINLDSPLPTISDDLVISNVT